MDVQIGEVSSSVKLVDNQSMMTPQMLATIARLVAQMLKQQEGHEERAGKERSLKTSVSGSK